MSRRALAKEILKFAQEHHGESGRVADGRHFYINSPPEPYMGSTLLHAILDVSRCGPDEKKAWFDEGMESESIIVGDFDEGYASLDKGDNLEQVRSILDMIRKGMQS